MVLEHKSNLNKEKCTVIPDNSSRNIASDDEVPPIYYDTEPSSQPPKYHNGHSTPDQTISSTEPEAASTTMTSSPKPTNQHRNSAQASTVAAILASPYDDLDAQRRADRKNKTLRERWKDFKERNFGEYDEGINRTVSAAEWNVQGGRIAGGVATPYRRNSKK